MRRILETILNVGMPEDPDGTKFRILRILSTIYKVLQSTKLVIVAIEFKVGSYFFFNDESWNFF